MSTELTPIYLLFHYICTSYNLKSMIMAQNEETLYFNNTHPEVRQESKDKTQNAADKATWKKVAVSGVAGIC